MHVLAAFDKFKDALPADRACRVAAETISRVRPDWQVTEAPLADGGEGFATILTRAANGRIEALPVLGPRFAERRARLGFIPFGHLPPAAQQTLGLDLADDALLGVIELAQASGIEGLSPAEHDPWATSTYGTGECLAFAIEQGVGALLVGLGGSATSDLGTGALQALGLQFLSADNRDLPRLTPGHWAEVDQLRGRLEHPGYPQGLPPLRIACDVNNPLLGPTGAAAVFGPQKGLKPEDFDAFDAAADRMADRLLAHFDQPASLKEEPGAGAAGGIAFGLRCAFPDSRLVPGFDLLTAWLDLDRKLDAADCVLTGEGKWDASSLHGKGPYAVLQAAVRKGVVSGQVFAGVVDPEGRDGLAALNPAYGATQLADPALPLGTNLAQTADRLAEAIQRWIETV
ncbi:MAG: glycerate kinase [Opitutales bacterium]